MDRFDYWYGSAFDGGGVSNSSELPPQAIPLNKKNKKWRERTMDALESIGRRQLVDNMKFADAFRMVEGKMSYSELSEVMPQYREVEDLLSDVELNTWVRHYDIIGVIVNTMVGELTSQSDKYSISTIDDISTNEYIREKTDKMWSYIQEKFGKELELRLIQRGINPNVSPDTFQSQEEMQQYMQQVEQQKAEMTPEQIDKYMKEGWRTVAAQWADLKIKEDFLNHDMHLMDAESFKHFLTSGRCFRHMRVGHDFYKPENWHVLNTFFSQDVDNKHVQHGEYVGRVHKMSRSECVNRYGDLLTPKEQASLLRDEELEYYNTYDGFDEKGISYKKIFESGLHRLQTVPFNDYPEYTMAQDIQNTLGVPMGERVYLNRHGEYEKVPVMLPEMTGDFGLGGGNLNSIFGAMRSDIKIRKDLLTVTEAYWRSYKRVGYLKVKNEKGQVESHIVTEEILPEYLEYYQIKDVKNVSLSNLDEDLEENSICWVWQPEIWKGVKIKDKDKDYYIDIKPLDYQIKGDSNVFDVLLPVSGYVGHGLATKIEPYQTMYNLVMNQIVNLLEKEIGIFYMFDVRFLPSEMKEWGDLESTLLHVRDLARDIGLVPVDGSKNNLPGGAAFNQFSVQNVSFGAQISDRVQLSDFIKNKAFEQIGITPQRLGMPSKYETAEGIKVSQNASYAQTEQYFSEFALFRKKSLDLQLNVAQYCQKSGKDLQVFYTQSDATQAFLKGTDENFNLRRFSIIPIMDPNKRKLLEQYKQWLIQTNTIGVDVLAMAEIMSSETMTEVIDSARAARMAQEQREEKMQQMQGEQAKELEAQKAENEQKMWEREEYSKAKDRDNRVKVATVTALGRAADNNSDRQGIDAILAESKASTDKLKAESEAITKRTEQELKQREFDAKREDKLNDLKVKVEELALRRKISEDNKYIARINKN